MNWKAILITILILAIVAYAINSDIDNYYENKEICKQAEGKWIKSNNLLQFDCLVNGAIYNIIETIEGKELIKK